MATALYLVNRKDFNGISPSKGLYIRFHCKPNVGLISIYSIDKDRASIRLYGNSAVVNRRVHVSKKGPDGSLRSFDVQRIEACIQQKGRWYIAAGQGTEVINK